ncbi:MAG: DUF2232 domain-containing protein [Gammaproteobacteria bacterium]
MISLARLAMRGPLLAAGLAAVLVLASLVLGVLLIPAGALVALTTLRHGPREGLKVAAIAASLVVAVRVGLGHALPASLLLCLVAWLPAWTMAELLRQRRAQAWPLLLAAALVLGFAVAMRLAVGDVVAYWRELFAPVFAALEKDSGAKFDQAELAAFASLLHAGSLAGLQVMLAAEILLARWWQAVLYNPGGFGAEFRELRLPRGLAIAGGIAALAYGFGGREVVVFAVAGDACVILVVLFALQGLAVIHFLARMRSMAVGWLATMYVMLVLVPQVTGPLLATTGLADNIADFRRLRRRQPP